MGNISERRKLRTSSEFRAKAKSLRTVAAELQHGMHREKILQMADAWDAKAATADKQAEANGSAPWSG
jgi:hypothetical protein